MDYADLGCCVAGTIYPVAFAGKDRIHKIKGSKESKINIFRADDKTKEELWFALGERMFKYVVVITDNPEYIAMLISKGSIPLPELESWSSVLEHMRNVWDDRHSWIAHCNSLRRMLTDLGNSIYGSVSALGSELETLTEKISGHYFAHYGFVEQKVLEFPNTVYIDYHFGGDDFSSYLIGIDEKDRALHAFVWSFCGNGSTMASSSLVEVVEMVDSFRGVRRDTGYGFCIENISCQLNEWLESNTVSILIDLRFGCADNWHFIEGASVTKIAFVTSIETLAHLRSNRLFRLSVIDGLVYGIWFAGDTMYAESCPVVDINSFLIWFDDIGKYAVSDALYFNMLLLAVVCRDFSRLDDTYQLRTDKYCALFCLNRNSVELINKVIGRNRVFGTLMVGRGDGYELPGECIPKEWELDLSETILLPIMQFIPEAGRHRGSFSWRVLVPIDAITLNYPEFKMDFLAISDTYLIFNVFSYFEGCVPRFWEKYDRLKKDVCVREGYYLLSANSYLNPWRYTKYSAISGHMARLTLGAALGLTLISMNILKMVMFFKQVDKSVSIWFDDVKVKTFDWERNPHNLWHSSEEMLLGLGFGASLLNMKECCEKNWGVYRLIVKMYYPKRYGYEVYALSKIFQHRIKASSESGNKRKIVKEILARKRISNVDILGSIEDKTLFFNDVIRPAIRSFDSIDRDWIFLIDYLQLDDIVSSFFQKEIKERWTKLTLLEVTTKPSGRRRDVVKQR